MPTGRVKFFNTDRGFGFILPDDSGPDVFVHVHDVETAGMKNIGGGPSIVIHDRPRA
jgi:cold shock protein